MQAVLMSEAGGPEVLIAREIEDPRPGPGEILVDTTAIPVLYPETLLRSGAFPFPVPMPVVFGFQAAGVITAVGPGTAPALCGTRVVAATAGLGGYAEKVCVPAEFATPIPDGLDTDAAAAVLMGGSVAISLLETAALSGTETVLVQAAAAGVGGSLTQLARRFGAARVIATAGGPRKGDSARALGADEVLDHHDPDWPERLRDVLGDATIDIVFDAIGGRTAARLLPALTPLTGRILGYGQLSGSPAEVTATDLMAAGLTYSGCAGPAWLGRVAAARGAALELAATGALRPMLGPVLPLDQAARAHHLIEQRATVGTIILRPNHAAG
ncbi:quinone oxidoreductase family protein [Nocardia sp. alder85J]|uniref:quinone oxidoreductase family protein n=1 Tax=Nocardia sp. alder85J TaxID=2862949 RepID=UPI001CD329D1|nr:zinc-binding dehydrogenase [Nocardia sp. alder85J]MCX4091195.1 zinc-binding dehydrogenase [Nocardia sp. alder85J]